MSIKTTIKRAFALSYHERRPVEKQFIKLGEEVGELAVEIQVQEGDTPVGKGSTDGINGECVDVMLMALAIFVANGGKKKEFISRMEEKMDKWESQMPTEIPESIEFDIDKQLEELS
tara:strand:+ start:98718 stop:99068 length:351 start_codon:yes stop_codon:yes gene_type:complete